MSDPFGPVSRFSFVSADVIRTNPRISRLGLRRETLLR
jgi:hypothetical protein